MAAASQIRQDMEVLGADGVQVGTVDQLEGDNMIKLNRSDAPDGKHHYLAVDLVDHVGEHVHLSITAEEAVEDWEDQDEDDEVELDQEPVSFGGTDEDDEDSDERAEERG
jgi:hypothetical protein